MLRRSALPALLVAALALAGCGDPTADDLADKVEPRIDNDQRAKGESITGDVECPGSEETVPDGATVVCVIYSGDDDSYLSRPVGEVSITRKEDDISYTYDMR